MNNFLSKLLAKKGIKDVSQMSVEEQETFRNYERILSKEKVTIEDFAKFLKTQLSIIEGKWQDLETPTAKKAEMIPYHTVYRILLNVISAPDLERQTLEDYLTQIINA
jgi:hypothetical protein